MQRRSKRQKNQPELLQVRKVLKLERDAIKSTVHGPIVQGLRGHFRLFSLKFVNQMTHAYWHL